MTDMSLLHKRLMQMQESDTSGTPQSMLKRIMQMQEYSVKQETENCNLLMQISSLQSAQKDLETAFRRLDQENARLNAHFLEKSALQGQQKTADSVSAGISDKQLKKLAAKFEKRVAALAAQRDAALETARSTTDHKGKLERKLLEMKAELDSARSEMHGPRLEIVRLQGLVNSLDRETAQLTEVRKENRALKSEQADLTARLEALHRVLDVSTRARETTAEVSETRQLLSELAESEAARDKAVQESQKSMRQLQEMSREADALYLQFQDDKFHKEDRQHVDVETTIRSASVQEKANHFDGFTEQDKLCQKEDELDVMRRLVEEN